jgi:hypothetical protein
LTLPVTPLSSNDELHFWNFRWTQIFLSTCRRERMDELNKVPQPSGQCYKTFYPSHLHGIAVILCYKITNITMVITTMWHQITMVKSFITLLHGGILKYWGKLFWYLDPRKCSYCGRLLYCFYNIGLNIWTLVWTNKSKIVRTEWHNTLF